MGLFGRQVIRVSSRRRNRIAAAHGIRPSNTVSNVAQIALHPTHVSHRYSLHRDNDFNCNGSRCAARSPRGVRRRRSHYTAGNVFAFPWSPYSEIFTSMKFRAHESDSDHQLFHRARPCNAVRCLSPCSLFAESPHSTDVSPRQQPASLLSWAVP
jgi:hypothetical protein